MTWPARPYKGLGYYEPEDRPIFAGREQDLDHCAALLGQVSRDLAAADDLGSSDLSINYRLYGDQFSFIGSGSAG